MEYVRGNRHNFDSWAARGATGWSYTDINQYFLKMEDNKNTEFLADGFHGSGGYLTVEQSAYEPEFKLSLLQSVKNLAFQVVDSNGYKQTGVYNLQADLRNQQRCNTAKAYLVAAENRTNLNILKNAFVTKILIKNKKAVGVTFNYDNKDYKVRARREIIISAGAINTPQLLMLSGIGPREDLQKFGFKVEADLPVGKNLQDHCYAIMPFAYSRNFSSKTKKLQDQKYIKQYIYNRTGFLPSTVGTVLMTFLNTKDVNSSEDNPNVQFFLSETTTSQSQNMNSELYEQVYKPYTGYPVFQCGVTAVQPKSRGTITLQSANPFDSPLIDPNYVEKDEDIEDIVEGMKICKEICTSQIIQEEIGVESFTTLYPGCEDLASDENEYFKCMAKAVCLTIFHQVGTAKMGSPTDPTTVVDAQLRVKGIENLRVVDASIMPTITSGNTNVPTMMIGEKASDMIKETLWLHN